MILLQSPSGARNSVLCSNGGDVCGLVFMIRPPARKTKGQKKMVDALGR
jgi:hypothetical protein